jgi:photosystem II stability/assembly factor-like uncharacterized protein
MKHRLLIAFLIVTSSVSFSYAQQYGWVNIGDRLPNTASTATITDIAMVGDSIWITSGYGNYLNGVAGEIYFSADHGNTFTIQTTMYGTFAIHMKDHLNGWCGGVEGQIYQTTNGGVEWVRRSFSFGSTLLDIDFPEGCDTGFCTGFNGKVKMLTPTGLSSVYMHGYVSHISSVSCLDSSHAFIAGEEIIGPVNHGTFLIDQSYPGTNGIYAIDMVDTLMGWCVGSPTAAGAWGNLGCMIIKTTDGHNWIDQVNPVLGNSGTLMAVKALDSLHVWTVGTSGVILRTNNGGNTWVREAEGLSNDMLLGIWVVSPEEVYVVGNNRTFLKYGLLSSIEESNSETGQVQLEQNYPNPFSSNTKISFQIKTPQQVKLSVFDPLGHKVAVLVNEYKPEGKYSIDFNATNLPSGIYYYRMQTGSFSETKKMILIQNY